MTTNQNDRIFGLLVSAAIGASFMVTSKVSAAPVFPPQHVSPVAQFSDAGAQDVSADIVPWYHSEQPAAEIPVISVNPVAATTLAQHGVEPWYRSAN